LSIEKIMNEITGTLQRQKLFGSRYVNPRTVDVWLPPAYDPAQRHAVLYMHDGQNLFDPTLAYGGVDWGMDETISRMTATGELPPLIVVGVWNTAKRVQEYMPQKPLAGVSARPLLAEFISKAGGAPLSDLYLRFLVEEVKPWVDANYPTITDPSHTAIMGSSMGGLISLYATVEYPQVFGRAGCVSTHWPIGGELLIEQLCAALPKPGQHKFYFDFGTRTLDAAYEPFQTRWDAEIAAVGYTHNVDWLTLKFEGAEHSETSWRERVHIPLKFLLGQE